MTLNYSRRGEPHKPSGKLVAAPPKPLINPGRYPAIIKDWEFHRQFGSTKILIQVEIEIDLESIILTYFTNVKTSENGDIIAPSSTMKLARTLGNLFPDSLFEEINLDRLIGIKCIAEVNTVTKDHRRKDKPEKLHYSTVEELFLRHGDKTGMQG